MSMHDYVDRQLRKLVGAVSYGLTLVIAGVATQWALPMPFWVVMFAGVLGHLAGQMVFRLVFNVNWFNA